MNILRVKVKNFTNKSGELVSIDNKKIKLKEIKRIFFIKQKIKTIRGNHAHKKCTQVLFQLKGKTELNILTKRNMKKIIMDEKKSYAFVIKPKKWISLKSLTKTSVTAVLCDKYFEKKDYIYNFDEL